MKYMIKVCQLSLTTFQNEARITIGDSKDSVTK